MEQSGAAANFPRNIEPYVSGTGLEAAALDKNVRREYVYF